MSLYTINGPLELDLEWMDSAMIQIHGNPTTDMLEQYHTITQDQYEQFEYYYVFDVLKGLRYGQAFCKRFGISNASPLYWFKGDGISKKWIHDNYLVK
jgi:hypothetical protein